MIDVRYDPIFGCTGWDFQPIEHYNYPADKNSWVYFGNEKKKEKLRKHIQVKASNLARLGGLTLETTRKILIAAYNVNGLKSVDAIYNRTLDNILKNLSN